jgi:Fe-S-cluster-containing hydrogenase component 2
MSRFANLNPTIQVAPSRVQALPKYTLHPIVKNRFLGLDQIKTNRRHIALFPLTGWNFLMDKPPTSRLPSVTRLRQETAGLDRQFRHAPRVDEMDGLEEYGGDFRNFENLEDAVVVDIFRRRRRGRTSSDHDPPAGEVVSNGKRAAAVSAPVGGEDPSPDAVRLISTGRTLIVGRDAEQVVACGRRLEGTQPCLTLVDGPHLPPKSVGGSRDGVLHAQNLRISGCLGRFNVVACIRGEETRLSRLLEGAPDHLDLVLDLRPASETGRDLLPPGYYLPDGDGRELERILAELPQMIGVFEKPRFMFHQNGECAHGRAGRPACCGCLDICPVDALGVADGSITIDQGSCVGCGLCAVVCPTGAMRCLHTTPQDVLVAVQGRLAEARPGKRPAPPVVFSQSMADGTATGDSRGGVDPTAFSVALEGIGCAGPEVWLAALAYGAGRVVVRLPDGYPVRLRKTLAGQLRWVTALLSGLGLGADRVHLTDDGSCGPATTPIPAAVPPADFSPFQPKRALIRASVAHLAGAGKTPAAGVVNLPVGASFGGVVVNPAACTLCMACAGACPTAALSASGDTPALRLVESECIQCGECVKVCPEQALSLRPRMVLDPARSGLPQLLHEQEALACIRCGRAFAPPGLVAKMIARLEGHRMFSREEDLRRLKMCRDCRVRDVFA